MEAAFHMKWPWAVLLFAVPSLSQTPPDFRMDVKLVRIPCIVAPANGAPVQDLRRDEFVVLEDGVRQEVQYLWHEVDRPLSVVLVDDLSCSQPRFVIQHRQTMLQFLD